MSGSDHILQRWSPVGVLHNMSVPPRTEVRIAVRAVYGVTAISLRRALRFNRGADSERIITRWRRASPVSDQARFPKLGCSPEQVEEANRTFGGVLIGWIVTRTDSTPDAETPVCEDLALTLAILSRRIGNLYLGHRAPDWSIAHLLEIEFLVDDPRLALTRRSSTWAGQLALSPGGNATVNPNPKTTP